jgi:hypothetical protein
MRPALQRLDHRTIEIARRVLVEGKKPAAVARETEVEGNPLTPQRIGQIVKTVEARLKIEDVPVGWEYVVVCVPKEKVEQIKLIEAEARANLSK